MENVTHYRSANPMHDHHVQKTHEHNQCGFDYADNIAKR